VEVISNVDSWRSAVRSIGNNILGSDAAMSPVELTEKEMDAVTREVFEIIPSYYDPREAKAISGVIARLILVLSPHLEKSAEVRGTLERYAASHIADVRPRI
jgi:hypothetical protein